MNDEVDLIDKMSKEAMNELVNDMNKQMYGDSKPYERISWRVRLNRKIKEWRISLGEWISGEYITEY